MKVDENFVKNKTVLVTGATDGIGLETALQLAKMDAKVLIHGRSKDKGAQAVEKISSETGNKNVCLYLADFASFSDIKRMAEDIKREQTELHVLINNAGNFYKERITTTDGIEMTFAVNHIAPFLLTLLLFDLLKGSTPARIVNVASSAHKMIKEVDFDNLQGEKHYDPLQAYALSKLGNVLFSYSLARLMRDTGVTVNALHPGVVATKLLKKSIDLEGISVEEGAKTSVMLATSQDLANITGRYFKNSEEKITSDISLDKELQIQFWKVSEGIIAKYLK